jgi:HlyD family secretion protein
MNAPLPPGAADPARAAPAPRPAGAPPGLVLPGGPPKASADPVSRWNAGAALRLGYVSAALLVFGLGGWAAFSSIAGAIVAPGQLKVETNRQVVQHPEGGVVGEILVEDGDRVKAGDVLIRLDGTLLRAELAIVESQLFESLARIGRLTAEQELAERIAFDPELLEVAAAQPEVASLVDGQRRLFEARMDTKRRETAQLRERQSQLREEIRGIEAQREALGRQLGFIEGELRDQRGLLERGLTQTSRVLSLEREKARLEGQIGAFTAQIAQSEGRITEIDIQITGRDAMRLEEAITELRDLTSKAAELREKRLSALETLSRLEVRAPRDGLVLGKTVFAVRSVVRPADPIMYIVPTEEALVVASQVPVTDIDKVYPGQPARLRFSAFSSRTTPEIDGSVKKVSADALTDERSGLSYYTAEIAISEAGLAQLDGLTLVPGMPVEAFIQTGERSPLSYLMQPLTDYFNRSMRED